MDFKPLDFDDIRPSVLPVKYGGKNYELREATAEAARQWGNAKARGLKFTAGKMTGVDGMTDCETLLVSQCLFEILGTDHFKAVHVDTVRSWPERVVSKLYKTLLRMSDMEDETEDAIKKQIEELQERLQDIQEGKPKNAPSSLTDTSA